MTRIFEVKTTCKASAKGAGPVNSTYCVAATDAEKAIAKIKQKKNYSGLERVMSVVMLASTD